MDADAKEVLLPALTMDAIPFCGSSFFCAAAATAVAMHAEMAVAETASAATTAVCWF